MDPDYNVVKHIKLPADEHGNFVDNAIQFQGFIWPDFTPNYPDFPENLTNMSKMEARPDDVLIMGYARTGNQWTWDLANMLVRDEATPITDRRFLDCYLPFCSGHTAEKWAEHRRVVFANSLPEHIPEDFIKNGCKIISINRNPKDVAVSTFMALRKLAISNYNAKFEHYLEQFHQGIGAYHGLWSTYYRKWEDYINSHPEVPVYSLRFEELLKDRVTEIGKLAEFLGCNPDPDFHKAVANASDIEVCRKAKENRESETEKKVFVGGKDPLLWKGVKGGWKHWLTMAQNERFDAEIKKNLEGSKLVFDFD